MTKLYDRKIEYLKSIGYNRYPSYKHFGDCEKFRKDKRILGIDEDVLSNQKYFKVFKRIINGLIK